MKYIRKLISDYLADEPMDELNKVLFAFASYNAGPGRIRQMRREAIREGDVPAPVISALDPRPEAEPANSTARLPADLRASRDWARSLPRQQDISDPDEPDAAIAATTARTATPLGDKPLVVISAGRLSWGERDRATGTPYIAALQTHVRSEAFLATLSRNSRFLVARASFHLVHLDEPALVIGAIEDVFAATRSGTTLRAR